MLPAADIAEFISSLASLKLETTTAAAVLAAVLAPLIRSAQPQQLVRPRRHAARARANPRTAAQQKRKKSRPRVAGQSAPQSGAQRTTAAGEPTAGRDPQRQRALVALKANRGISLTKVAAIAGVSRSTVCNAARELAVEARQASATPKPAAKPLTEARARAQRFLRDELAHGQKPVSAVEEAAERAHIEAHALTQARNDLGLVTTRGNAGGVMAVQWSLPG